MSLTQFMGTCAEHFMYNLKEEEVKCDLCHEYLLCVRKFNLEDPMEKEMYDNIQNGKPFLSDDESDDKSDDENDQKHGTDGFYGLAKKGWYLDMDIYDKIDTYTSVMKTDTIFVMSNHRGYHKLKNPCGLKKKMKFCNNCLNKLTYDKLYDVCCYFCNKQKYQWCQDTYNVDKKELWGHVLYFDKQGFLSTRHSSDIIFYITDNKLLEVSKEACVMNDTSTKLYEEHQKLKYEIYEARELSADKLEELYKQKEALSKRILDNNTMNAIYHVCGKCRDGFIKEKKLVCVYSKKDYCTKCIKLNNLYRICNSCMLQVEKGQFFCKGCKENYDQIKNKSVLTCNFCREAMDNREIFEKIYRAK